MIAYDESFDPPAPTLLVTIAGVVKSRPRVQIPALIDTGSDITAIPATIVKKLNLYPLKRLQMEDVNAAKIVSHTYGARLTVAQVTTREMEVIQTGLPFAVLGRDWLQDYYLLLNGPARNFQLSATPLSLE